VMTYAVYSSYCCYTMMHNNIKTQCSGAHEKTSDHGLQQWSADFSKINHTDPQSRFQKIWIMQPKVDDFIVTKCSVMARVAFIFCHKLMILLWILTTVFLSKQVVKVILQKTHRPLVLIVNRSLKTFRLNGFKIKRFMHCLNVLVRAIF